MIYEAIFYTVNDMWTDFCYCRCEWLRLHVRHEKQGVTELRDLVNSFIFMSFLSWTGVGVSPQSCCLVCKWRT